MTYQRRIGELTRCIQDAGAPWAAIDAESAARMQVQNRFVTGVDIARHTAAIMRADMASYDADPAAYTQSAGGVAWLYRAAGNHQHQEALRHARRGAMSTSSGWMIAALRSEFGPLPDQSMHEKTSVPALIGEIYTFLKQADARELGWHVPRARLGARGRR